MLTNEERRAQIQIFKSQLRQDLAKLEKQYKQDVLDLERKCSVAIANIELDMKAAHSAELQAARAKVHEIIAAAGLDPAAVFAGLHGARSAAPATPRGRYKPSTKQFTGPDGQVWNGRGRVPTWYKQQQSSTSSEQQAQ